ncbi:unnamed protein product [Schistocephalus solidus]|uniref:Sortilin n=1 Tax=Schistocephalus solidus TaxID=70667 RepID=A0A183SKV6_SCHSO|nr:unnamed protein product [Schistocephalus solidus]
MEERIGDLLFMMFMILHAKNDKELLTLSKSANCGWSWEPILTKVRKMWVPEIMQNDEFTPWGQEGQQKLGRFLYVMHYNEDESKVQLSVSDDGGLSFKRVHLPTVAPERFFNVLEVDEDFVFLHVDEPDDTGYGTLYVSDSTGTVFSESLRRHLYPNHSPVTDFFRVASMRGTFLATQLNPDSTLRTVITHDRGATWKPLPIPEGMEQQCGGGGNQSDTGSAFDLAGEDANSQRFRSPNSPLSLSSPPDASSAQNISIVKDTSPGYKKVCGLQISNQFSMRSRVVASPPLAIPTARGLILAHGHVSTHLKNTPADGYVSSDGGYHWRKVRLLDYSCLQDSKISAFDGPHHYQIANRGGLIVAVPADTLWVDVLRFSTDEGRCWHTIPLTYSRVKTTSPTLTTDAATLVSQSEAKQRENNTSNGFAEIRTPTPTRVPSESDETVVFTGLVTEPGGQAMTVAVYGYGTVSQRWRVAVVDFSTNGVISRNCTAADYEVWTPHEDPAKEDASDNGCLLGMKEFFYRLKEDSL